MARSDALFPVAPGRRSRAGPGVRGPLAAIQAAPRARVRRKGTAAATRALRHRAVTRSSTMTSPPRIRRSSTGCISDYLAWFRDVCGTRGFAPVRIRIGDPRENPTLLTRQDWRRSRTTPESPGRWELEVARPGRYEVTIHVSETTAPTKIRLDIQGQILRQALPARSLGDHLSRRFARAPAPPGSTLGLRSHDNRVRVLDATVTRVGDK